MNGLKAAGGLFALTLVSALVCVGTYMALEVIATGFVITKLPFGQEAAMSWYVEEYEVTSRARVGFPLEGYAGSGGTLNGLPVPYPVTSHFGYAADYFGGTKYHTGVDMACPQGTPVSNVLGGKVTFAGYSQAGYGNLVVVENNGTQVFYGHLSEIDVQPGQEVSAGQVVGLTGNTGFSTGPHLHFEVRQNGRPVDPLGTDIVQGGSSAP